MACHVDLVVLVPPLVVRLDLDLILEARVCFVLLLMTLSQVVDESFLNFAATILNRLNRFLLLDKTSSRSLRFIVGLACLK